MPGVQSHIHADLLGAGDQDRGYRTQESPRQGGEEQPLSRRRCGSAGRLEPPRQCNEQGKYRSEGVQTASPLTTSLRPALAPTVARRSLICTGSRRRCCTTRAGASEQPPGFRRSPAAARDQDEDQKLALGAPIPGSICMGPLAEGLMSKSKMAVGRYTVAHEFGISTTPEKRPSIGAEPSRRYACSGR